MDILRRNLSAKRRGLFTYEIRKQCKEKANLWGWSIHCDVVNLRSKDSSIGDEEGYVTDEMLCIPL